MIPISTWCMPQHPVRSAKRISVESKKWRADRRETLQVTSQSEALNYFGPERSASIRQEP